MVLPQSHRGNLLTFRALKTGVFTVEALNALATSFYFNYLFFYLKESFGNSNAGNLLFSAANGFIYIFLSLYAGKFSQKRGYFVSLRLGITIVTTALCISFFATSPLQLFFAMALWTCGICFTWPILEALSAEHESSTTLPRKIGIYNVVWAAGQGGAYFVGGATAKFLGWRSIFLVPIGLHILQFILVLTLARAAKGGLGNLPEAPVEESSSGGDTHPEVSTRNKAFLRMAWWTNPFCYIAINTIIPLVPSGAARLELTPMTAGFVYSLWMFSRMAAFIVLWKWTAWHYRFGWLVSSFILLIGTFAGILLAPNLWMLVIAQLALGWAVGLIYYSSLFYSMDSSETKGEHGGIHESAIGSGLFLGPAIGFAALHFFPQHPNSSAIAVSAVLFLGLGGLIWLRNR